MSLETIPLYTGFPSLSTRQMPFPYPVSPSPAISCGSIPALWITSFMSSAFVFQTSFRSLSTRPAQGSISGILLPAEMISLPFRSKTAAFVVEPPLSIPIRYCFINILHSAALRRLKRHLLCYLQSTHSQSLNQSTAFATAASGSLKYI